MENILKSVGEFGVYQKYMCLIIGFIPVLTSISIYSTVFTLAEPNLICVDKDDLTAKIPDDMKCKIWQNLSDSKTNNDSHSKYECHFDTTYYHDTLITEFGLICDKKIYASLLPTWYLVGTFASLFVGFLSDKYGRKKIVVISLIILSITLILNQFVNLNFIKLDVKTNYIINSIAQFIIGATCYTCHVVAFILLSELTTNKYGNLVSCVYLYLYVAGETINLFVAYFAKNWIIINIFLTMLSVFILTISLFFIPESPRFLITKNKFDKASDILNKIKKKNHGQSSPLVDIEEIKMNSLNASKKTPNNLNENNSSNLAMEIKDNRIKKFFFLVFIWFALNMSYYGVSLGITAVGDLNPYIVYVLGSIAELIGYLGCLITNKFNLKTILLITSVSAGFSCLGAALIPDTQAVIKIVFALFGKALVSAFFNLAYVYTNQMFPTNIRNTFFLLVSSLGNIGAFISPQINLLQNLVWRPLPYIIFGSSSFMASLFIFLLPDPKTLNYF